MRPKAMNGSENVDERIDRGHPDGFTRRGWREIGKRQGHKGRALRR